MRRTPPLDRQPLLEITESVALANEQDNLQELHKLPGMGFGVALDDFGTGYSSLGYLQRFPIDVLKLDQSFMRDLGVNNADAAVARATLELANSLSIRVMAGGVGNETQLRWLRVENCQLIQGFLLSEPLDASACEQLFLHQTNPAYAVTETLN